MTTTVKPLLRKELEMESSITHQSLGISIHSPLNTLKVINEWLMSLQRDSHVSRSAPQERAEEVKTKEINGRLPLALLEKCSLNGSYWKTSQAFLEGMDTLAQSLKTWPKAGTMQDGVVYLRKEWEPRISANGCGSWPTPRASDWKGAINAQAAKKVKERGYSPNLSEAVAEDQNGGRLNPMWVEWLMGWPIGATDSKPLEMDKFRRWLEKHGGI